MKTMRIPLELKIEAYTTCISVGFWWSAAERVLERRSQGKIISGRLNRIDQQFEFARHIEPFFPDT